MSNLVLKRKKVACMGYLSGYTLEHLRLICKYSNIDVSKCTVKDEILDAIRQFDTIIDPELPIDQPVSSPSSNTRKHLENIQQLDESKHDITAWLSSVERQLKRQDFDICDWSAEVEPFLTGTALRAFDHLPDIKKDDWIAVKETILRAYNLTEESFRQRFRSQAKSSQESFFELSNQLQQHFHRWVKTPDHLFKDSEYLRITELIIVEQLISSVGDENLRRKLAESEPKTLDSISTLADQYVNGKNSSYFNSSSSRVDHKNRDRKHQFSPKSTRSYDHKHSYDQKSSSSTSQSQPSTIKCFTCGEPGHKSPDCTSKKSATSSFSQQKPKSTQQHSSKKSLESIGNFSAQPDSPVDGHFAHVTINEQPMLAYLDNGSPRSIITPIIAELLGLNIESDISQVNLVAANNKPLKIFGITELTTFSMGNMFVQTSFLVADITRPILLGRDILVDMLSVTLNFSKLTYRIGDNDESFPLIMNMPVIITHDTNVQVQEPVAEPDAVPPNDNLTAPSTSFSDQSNVNPETYIHPFQIESQSEDMPFVVPLSSDLSNLIAESSSSGVVELPEPSLETRQESSCSSVSLIKSHDRSESIPGSDGMTTLVRGSPVIHESNHDIIKSSDTLSDNTVICGTQSHHTNWYDVLVSDSDFVDQTTVTHSDDSSTTPSDDHVDLPTPAPAVSAQINETCIVITDADATCAVQTSAINSSRHTVDVNTISERNNFSEIVGLDSITVDPQFIDHLNDIKVLISEFPDVFREQPGYCDVVLHQINLVEDAKPFKIPPYRLSPAKRESLLIQIQDMLDQDIITEISSDFCSSPVLVPKKDGTWRLAIDYRQLNSITVPDHYPLPTPEQILSQLRGSVCYSTLDLVKAFWQAALDPRDWPKTAFAVAGIGLFCFKRLAFGLRNASSLFQRTMDRVLIHSTGVFTNHFIDDILVNSTSPEQHLADLKSTLVALRQAGLTANLRKCNFMRSHVKFLGYILSQNFISINPDKYHAIAQYPRPHDIKSLMRFLGLMAWCSKFIPHCSTLCEPLNSLKRKDVPWVWSESCERAFCDLKSSLCESVSLALPNFSIHFEIHCDASNVGLGGALVQTINGVTHVISFASRTLTSSERNYSTTSKEVLSIVWCLELWHEYLLPNFQTVVYSDHQAISWLQSSKASQKNQRQIRWLLRLQPFNFIVKYRAGRNMIVPDSLSRAPVSFSPSVTSVESIELAPDYDKNECYSKNCMYGTESESDINYDWIACDGCNEWFHIDCVGLSKNESEEIPTWFCSECKTGHPVPETNDQVSSRSVQFTIPEKETFLLEQKNDANLSTIYNYLLDNSVLPQNSADAKRIKAVSVHYQIKDGVLLKQGKIVVPQSLVKAVIRNYHSKPTSGHLGVRKTLWKISQVYQWKGMRNDVKDFIKICQICQFCKPSYRKPKGLMQTVISTHVNEILSADFMGPFPKTAQNFQYLLVLEDHFSKFILLFPVVHANSYVLRYIVNYVLCTFGGVEKLLSDNGPQFVAHRFLTFLRDWGVVQSLCIPHHPQANPVERVNRNLKSMLSCFHSADHTHWADFLCEFQFALNSVIHDTTGYSPARIFLGRELSGPGDNAVISFPSRPVDSSENLNRNVAANSKKRADYNKSNYDQTRSDQQFSIGDLVLVRSFVLSNAKRKRSAKLSEKWRGPYKVIRKLTPLTYHLQHQNDCEEKVKVAHSEQMKNFHA